MERKFCKSKKDFLSKTSRKISEAYFRLWWVKIPPILFRSSFQNQIYPTYRDIKKSQDEHIQWQMYKELGSKIFWNIFLKVSEVDLGKVSNARRSDDFAAEPRNEATIQYNFLKPQLTNKFCLENRRCRDTWSSDTVSRKLLVAARQYNYLNVKCKTP